MLYFVQGRPIRIVLPWNLFHDHLLIGILEHLVLMKYYVLLLPDLCVCRKVVCINYYVVGCHLLELGAWLFALLEEIVLDCVRIVHFTLLSYYHCADCSLTRVSSLNLIGGAELKHRNVPR